MTKWKVEVDRRPVHVRTDLYIWCDKGDDMGLVEPVSIQFTKNYIGFADPKPTLTFPGHEHEDFLRAIMDAAWEMGIRPTGFEDHTNELTAVRYHLEDMRKLAKVV